MNLRTMPTTFAALAATVGERSDRTIANNTTASYAGDHYVIALHGNIIALVYANGGVDMRTTGYVTTTTADRLKRFAPAGWGVSRAGGVMHAYHPGTGDRIDLSAYEWTRVGAPALVPA